MADASTMLDPQFKNPELRAFAYLSARYTKGARSAIDCLLPFVTFAVSAHEGEQFDIKKVQQYLKSSYRLYIPYYMLERMVPELKSLGALKESDVGRILVCKDASSKIDAAKVDFSPDEIASTEDALAAFALDRGYKSPTTAGSWNDLLIPFLQSSPPNNTKAAASVHGKLITGPASVDYTIVAEFIMHNFSHRTPIYKLIEKLYYGVIVAEFLTQIESSGKKSSYRGLFVIYDSPFILRLLGCSGSILRLASEELHETLRDMGCRVFYYQHTYDEILSSIDGIINAYENRRPIFKETNEAIARGELTMSEVYNIRTELDYRLSAQLGLTAHPKSYDDRSQDDFQIDEGAFREALKGERGWGAIGSTAAEKDSKSLALTMRLRAGKQDRDISKSRYVFITHNPALAGKARRFLIESGDLSERSVSPILTVGQMSTVAWVASEIFQDSGRISKELIANCYAAALPDEDFDQELRKKLVSVDPKAASQLFENAYLVQSVREIALQRTSGHSGLIGTLNTAEIVALASEQQNKAINEAIILERLKVIDQLEEISTSGRSEKIQRVAHRISLLVTWIIALGCCLGSLYSVSLFGLVSGKVNYPLGIVLGAVGVWSILDRFKLLGIFSFQASLAKWLTRPLKRIQDALS